jgi:peptidoglycan lytic transglycosylase G
VPRPRTWLTLLVVLAVLAGAAAWGGREALRYPSRPNPGAGRTVTVTVARGARLAEVADELHDAGLIDRPLWFRIYVGRRGLGAKVRAGTYHLRDDLTPTQVLDALVKGVDDAEAEIAVTIPEGKNLPEVFAILADAGLGGGDVAAFSAVAWDRDWLAAQGIPGDSAEGYLFPDTYRVARGAPARAVLEIMVKRFRQVMAELEAAHGSPSDLRATVILASIVEKETSNPDERARVASVMVNRLDRARFPSRRLETDPATRYGCLVIPPGRAASRACRDWDPAGRLHRAQLDDRDNPYNTYQHAGLPPGPIANPGRASLQAALAPEPSDYLFFVAKDERSHVFSRTYEEHARWVAKYVKEK